MFLLLAGVLFLVVTLRVIDATLDARRGGISSEEALDTS
jgi:hypothetical protein